MHLFHANPSVSFAVLAIKFTRMSSDLYGNDVVSSFELAKDFTPHVANYSDIHCVPEEIVELHIIIVAKWKLKCIFRLHTFRRNPSRPVTCTSVHTAR